MTPELSAKLGEQKAERVLLLTVTAWDGNCQQHIPQKFNAADVARALEERDARIYVMLDLSGSMARAGACRCGAPGASGVVTMMPVALTSHSMLPSW